MLYTLQDDDRLIIYNLFYTPETNDVIVINYEPRNELLVKRIIGVEGDKVKINFSTWEIWVNDKYLEQPYLDMNPDKGIIPMKQGNLVDVDENNCIEFTVEEGKVFVLGDNRNGSSDSRVFGQLDADEIMGKVIFRVFPFESAGAIE
jgi:signal peptidase I